MVTDGLDIELHDKIVDVLYDNFTLHEIRKLQDAFIVSPTLIEDIMSEVVNNFTTQI